MENTNEYTSDNTLAVLDKPPAYRFWVFIIMTLGYILLYAGIQIVASVSSEMMLTLGIEEGKLSILSSLAVLTMAIVSVFTGAAMTKWGGKLTTSVGLGILTVSGLFYLLGPKTFAVIAAIRLFQGIGTGITNVSTMALITVWFPKKERSTASGIMAACYGLSMTAVSLYAFTCTNAGLHWNQTAGLMLLIMGGVLLVLVLSTYKDIEKKHGVHVIDEAIKGYDAFSVAKREAEERAKNENKTKPFHRPTNWHEALHFPGFYLLDVAVFFYCATFFGVSFVLALYLPGMGFSAAQATAILSWTFLSHIASSPLGGILSDRLFKTRRCEMTIIAFVGAVIGFSLFHTCVVAGTPIMWLTVIAFFAYFVLSLAGGVIWVLPVEIVSADFAQQNFGTCLLCSGSGGFLSTIVAGYLMQSFGVAAGLYFLIFCMAMVAVMTIILMKKYRC